MIRFEQADLIITDPCYILPENLYEDFLSESNPFGIALTDSFPYHKRYVAHIKDKEGIVLGYGACTNIGDSCWKTYSIKNSTKKVVGHSCADSGLTCIVDIKKLGLTDINKIDGTVVKNFTGTVKHYATMYGFTWVLIPDNTSEPIIYAGDIGIKRYNYIPKNSVCLTDGLNDPNLDIEAQYLLEQSCGLETLELDPIDKVYDTKGVNLKKYLKDFTKFIKKDQLEIAKQLYVRYQSQINTGKTYKNEAIVNKIKDVLSTLDNTSNLKAEWLYVYQIKKIFDTGGQNIYSILRNISCFNRVDELKTFYYSLIDLMICFENSTLMPNVKRRYIFNKYIPNCSTEQSNIDKVTVKRFSEILL